MKQDNIDTREIGFASPLKSAFLPDCVRVPVENLIALKKLSPTVKKAQKYQQILASVREVGLVEPPAVAAVPKRPGWFYLVDGHLRVEALKDIGVAAVDCMVATDDDTYTYNKRINRLSAVQDHKMIVRAVERGVSVERLAAALGLAEETIRHRFRLLNGICDEAAGYLADKPCPAKIFETLRQMKPLRQIEAAELMIGQNIFSPAFVTAILAATPPEQLIPTARGRVSDAVSVDSMARMERELATLQAQNSVVEDSYGPDVLHLTVIKAYISSMLSRASIVRWLAQHQPEYLKEFQRIADMTDLGAASHLPSRVENRGTARV
jgi:hypothetical protein